MFDDEYFERLEKISAQILQGLVSTHSSPLYNYSKQEAEIAVKYARALIEEIDRTKRELTKE